MAKSEDVVYNVQIVMHNTDLKKHFFFCITVRESMLDHGGYIPNT